MNMEKNGKPSKKFGASVMLGTLAAVVFIGVWEGGKLPDGSSVAYADRLAGNLPTVCGGITRHITDTPIVVGETWSKEKCEAEEQKALIKIQTNLEQCFKIAPPQSVFEAATSHAWNLGVGATCGSAAMRAWNEGNWELGCNRIAFADSGRRVWSYVRNSDGSPRFVQGLANRRDAERKLCLQDIEVLHNPAQTVNTPAPVFEVAEPVKLTESSASTDTQPEQTKTDEVKFIPESSALHNTKTLVLAGVGLFLGGGIVFLLTQKKS